MKTNCGIYKITNIKNKKVYIGSSVNLKSRKSAHFRTLERGEHPNTYLQKSFIKHGIANFKWDVIEWVELLEDRIALKKILLEKEQSYIDNYSINGKVDTKICYNLYPIAGSPLGTKTSDSTKNKIRLALLNKPKAKEHVERVANSNRGKKHNMVKKRNPVSEEGKKNMRDARIGKPSNAKGIKWSEEAKKNMSDKSYRKRRVKNITTNKVFDSILEASTYYNVTKSNISLSCQNKRKTAGGYEWEYVIKEEEEDEGSY